jgi:hypothetical protein
VLLQKLQLRLSRKCSAATGSCPFPVTLWVTSVICGGNKKYKRHIVCKPSVIKCQDMCRSMLFWDITQHIVVLYAA